MLANLGFTRFRPRKSRHEVGVFRAASQSAFSVKQASRSELPAPSRRTFTTAFLASVHCTSAALRHPWLACFRSPLKGTGSPSLVNSTPRQEAANEYQRMLANLGFARFRPRKSRHEVGVFRKASQSAFSVKQASLSPHSAARTRSLSTSSPAGTARFAARPRRFERSARCRWSR